VLVGWVSDERDVALEDVVIEFDRDGETSAVTRSTARGRIHADLPPGSYRATFRKAGFGAKSSPVEVGRGREPTRFRLLSDRLTGFVWPKWSRAGNRAEHRFHATEAYGLSLWRYGLEMVFVRDIGWFDEHGPNAVMQITPDGDYTQTGVDWNRVGYGSNPHLSQLMEAPVESGLYYVHARTESGGFFAAPWVVAPAGPQAPIVVLASTNTWNAYNNFGGRSNYINTAGLPPEPIVNARQDLGRYAGGESLGEWSHSNDAYPPLSFERPEPFNHVPWPTRVTDPIAGRQACHLAPAEWRLLAWLEREGFAYDLYADAQLDDGTLDLAAYRVLILNTHPEYWTRRMFERARDWVGAGGRLAYLGGNGLNCEVEIADGRMRALTELHSIGGALGMADEADPSIWYDSRFSRTVEPEAALLGVATTDAGIMTGAPYRVVKADHWAFAGTGLSDGDTMGERSLHERCPGGASGHETDKMTGASPPGAVLLAKGLNPDEGGAEIVYHESGAGGAVFSVGSITWPSSVLVDDAVSRITRTVLERFLA
jgi:N,N-dimethylformamidase